MFRVLTPYDYNLPSHHEMLEPSSLEPSLRVVHLFSGPEPHGRAYSAQAPPCASHLILACPVSCILTLATPARASCLRKSIESRDDMADQAQKTARGAAAQEQAEARDPRGGGDACASDVPFDTRRLVLADEASEPSHQRPSLVEARPTSPARNTQARPGGATERRKENERFRKRRLGLLKKAEQLRADFGVQAYVVIHRGDRYFTYTSLPNQPDWPPPPMVLVSGHSDENTKIKSH